jgi:hypothetical protein
VAVITIAVGVSFLFLVFSLVVSAINEGLVGLTSLRAKVLWTTLRHVSAPEGDRNSRLTLSGMVGLLFSVGKSDPRPREAGVDSLPVEAVAEPGSGGDAFLASVLDQTRRFESGTRRSRLKQVSPVVVSRAIVELGDMTARAPELLEQIRAAVRGTQLERPVAAAISEAGNDIEKFRAAIEGWFDSRMQALSSLYKMWSRWILLCIALVVAFVVDVNPVVAVDLLRKDTALAQATVDQATAFAANEQLPISGCPSASTATTSPGSDALQTCYQAIRNAVARTRALPPPLSFSHFGRGDERAWQYIAGCLVGAVAISLGAPFWFDVLRRLMSLRS